jgi:hypothetical protein
VNTKPAARALPKQKAPRRADRTAAAVKRSAPAVSPGGTTSSPAPLLLFLVLACSLSLLFIGLAVAPPWALPRQVSVLAYDHRHALALTGIVIGASVGVAVVVAGLTS